MLKTPLGCSINKGLLLTRIFTLFFLGYLSCARSPGSPGSQVGSIPYHYWFKPGRQLFPRFLTFYIHTAFPLITACLVPLRAASFSLSFSGEINPLIGLDSIL